MRAVVLTGHGGDDKLEYRIDYPKPVPGDGEVVIRVGACGVNNTDINTRTAWYSQSATAATTGVAAPGARAEDAAWGGSPILFPRVQGADIAGVVEAAGPGANAALVGRRVLVDNCVRDGEEPDNLEKAGYLGSECDGGFAEFVKIHERQVHPIESDLRDIDLATFATSYSTAENMLDRAQVGDGDSVLITGASGGVGSALIQLAKRRGAKTVALCANEKADAVRAAGADAVLPRAPADLRAALAALGRPEVDVVADVVGGDLWPQVVGAIKRGGRYVCSGAIAGPIVRFDLRPFYLRDLAFFGATVTTARAFRNLVGYIERGEIRPLVAAVFPLPELRAAQAAFVAKKHIGNIVICP